MEPIQQETDRLFRELYHVTHSVLAERSLGAQVQQQGKTVDTADRRNPAIVQGKASARRFTNNIWEGINTT